MHTTLPLTQLERIYDLLEHPAIDHHSIYYKVRAAFRDANYQWPKPVFQFSGFYRASGLKPTESHEPELDRLSYPKPVYAGLGRCNWAGEPMFYCSNENGVPVYEIRAKKGTVFAMSKWVSQAADPQNVVMSPSIIGIDRIIATLGDDSNLEDFLKHYIDVMPAEIQEIDAFLGDLFARPHGSVPNLYWFTSAVARVVLGDLKNNSTKEGLDGLMYPSIQSQFTGFNLAIKPAFVDRNLRLEGSAIRQVFEHDESTYSYSIGALRGLRGIDSSGKAIWVNVHPDDAHKRWELAPHSPVVYSKVPPTLRYEDEV